MQLRAHTENLVVQSVENELILVDLKTGSYYSLAGSGAVIFSLLDSGCSSDTDELVMQLGEFYATDLSPHKQALEQFIAQLLAESLLVSGVGTCQLSAGEFKDKPFDLPILNKYEDLQDLILLDPVRGLPSLNGTTVDSQFA